MAPQSERLSWSLALLALLSLLVIPYTRGQYVFSSACDTSPYNPENETAIIPSCPACCKVPLNLSFVGTPVKTFPNTGNADKCISLCADHSFYSVDTEFNCRCYDECDKAKQQASVSTDLVALGNVTACLSACFPRQEASETLNKCQCPEHALCIPAPARDPRFRCCCKSTYSFPTLLPDNSTVCMAFQLGANLAGVTTVSGDDNPAIMTSP